jgi:hypothetical protein
MPCGGMTPLSFLAFFNPALRQQGRFSLFRQAKIGNVAA